jgi:hypothetical protein
MISDGFGSVYAIIAASSESSINRLVLDLLTQSSYIEYIWFLYEATSMRLFDETRI